MGSDRARLSYDEKQQYRAVIAQQGRVTLEADWNEAQTIGDEARRAEALDIVGPSGTPDDGWAVVVTGQVSTPPFDIFVSDGTMYVGGERAFLDVPVRYSVQPEWLDASDDPDWVDPAKLLEKVPDREFVYMLLREQEVSAVEDAALRDVALGGPDSAARTRIVRHLVRLATEARDCPGALAQAEQKWAQEGLAFEPSTTRLTSDATLQVSFAGPQNAPNNCDPQAQGGYLGADNQLIRVQISSLDANQQARLVWGFDNASFLYRVDAVDDHTLHLQARPVDEFHQPHKGQAVEVLRATARLANGEYLAATTGVVVTLDAPYVADKQQIILPTGVTLPPEYLDPKQTSRLFLRVWEEEQALTPGQPVLLNGTGFQVTLATLALPNNGPFHVGDFWAFAVRPNTAADPAAATQVYPPRYLAGPQPPEGPRLWAVPLAVIQWANRAYTVLDDCREVFDNLVELTRRRGAGCCTVTVGPADIARGQSLQAILDRFKSQDRVNICLMPGTYELPAPLVLGPEHSNITIEGCHDGVWLQAAAGKQNAFLQGLIVLNRADNVTLRRLRFRLPVVPFTAAGGRLAGLDTPAIREILGAIIDGLRVTIGIRPVHCALLTVEDCLFRFEIGANNSVFGAGIFASGECWGLTVQRNRFVRDEEYLRRVRGTFYLLFGYLLAPSITLKAAPPITINVPRVPAGTLVRSLVHDAIFRDNLFDGLTGAVWLLAAFGNIDFASNTVRRCRFGFWLLTIRALASLNFLGAIAVRPQALEFGRVLGSALAAGALDQIVQIGAVLARGYPLPAGFDATRAIPVPDPRRKVQPSGTTPHRLQALFDTALSFFTSNAALKPEVTPRPAPPNARPADTPPAQPPNSGTTPATPPVTPVRPRRQLLNLNLSLAAHVVPDAARFAALHGRLSTFEAQALAQAGRERGLNMALQLTGNEIDTRVDKQPSGIALWVIDDPSDTAGTLTMTGNRVHAFLPNSPAVEIFMVQRASVTGNLILNEATGSFVIGTASQTAQSLVLAPGAFGKDQNGAGIAVTGNVFQGRPILPARPATNPPAPPPMDRWEFFNTEL